MSLGSLRVLLGLDAAEFTTGLTKAEARLKNTEQQVKKFSGALQKDIAFGVGKAITALTALDRVGGFLIRFGFDAIKAAASFEDLGEKTGGSAEKLASFQTAADITKTSMESVGDALVKLTKGLAGADEETKGAANAVQKLGFNLAEFKELDSATQFEQLAKRLNEFADSNTKTSAAVQLFGKAGANQLSLMKELANQTDRSTILTKAHIKTADDFADKQAKVTSELKQYVGVVGIAVLPVLTELSKAFVDVIKNMTEMDKATGTLKASNAVRDWAETTAIAIATLAESLAGIAKLIRAVGGSFQAVGADISFAAEALAEGPSALINRDASKIKAALAERNKIVEEANQRYVDLWNYNGTAVSDALRKNFALRRELERDIAGGVAPGESTVSIAAPKPKLPDWFGGGKSGDKATKAAQEAKKLLDKQLSDIDNFIKAEKRIFETRESDLARLYQSDQISIAAYFDERLAALDRNTTATVELYNEQIKAQEAFANAARRRKDEPAAIDAQKQIGRIQSEIEDVLHEKQQRKLKIQDDLTQAAGDYADQVTEVRARVLELLGTEEAALEAAKLRFDIQNRSVIKVAKREKDSALEEDIATLRRQSDAQTQINVQLNDAAVIEQKLATAQAKLHLERDLGMRDEITTLDLLAKSSVEAAAKLQIIADKYLAIAQADGSKLLIANAEAFKQKINEMAAATDILAAKIRQTFVDTGASAIETFLNSVSEGKNVLDSFKAAFTQFTNDIIRQINRIAAQKIADAIFKGGSGGGSDIASILGFGGGFGGGRGGGGADLSGPWGITYASGTDFVPRDGMAYLHRGERVLTASENRMFGSIADAFIAYIGRLSGKEKGGPVASRTPYVVGERGPEIFVPRTVAAEATKQIDSLIAQRGKPAEYTDRVKAATVATNLPHLIGAKGPEIFVPKMDGIVIPNDKVNKLSRVLQGRAKGGPVVRATPYIVGERGPEIFTPRNAATLGPHEKVVTRLVSSVQPKASQVASNRPRVVGARGPELFVSKAAGIIISHDKVAKLARSFGNDRPKVPSYSPPGGTPRLAGQMLAVGRSSQPTDFDLSSERSSLVAPAAAVARRREISASLVAARTILRDEKIITRYANAPYSRPVAARVPYIGGREIPKPANAAVQRDEAINKLSTALQKQGRDTSASVASSGISAAKASRIISDRPPQVYIQSATEIRERAVGPVFPTVIGAERALKQATEPSKRAVAELALDAPRQRRVGVGPVATRPSYFVGEHGREIFIPKSANTAVQRDEAISKLSKAFQKQGHSGPAATAQATRIINERQIYIQKSASAIQQSKRAVAELVLNAPRQRRARGGPVAAHTPYVVGELGPELFMPKSAERVINNEKARDDLVSNNIQHRASSAPKVTYIGEQGHEIFISKLASTNIKNEKFINDLVSNTVQRRAIGSPIATRTPYIIGELGAEVPKAARRIIRNDLVLNTRNAKTINQLVSNIQRRTELESYRQKDHRADNSDRNFAQHLAKTLVRPRDGGSFAAHQTYLIGERPELVVTKSAEKIIKNENLVSKLVTNNVKRNEKIINDLVANSVRRSVHQTHLVGEHGREIFAPKSVRKIIKNKKIVDDLISNVQRRAIGGPVAAHQTYLVGELGPEPFVQKLASKIIKNEILQNDLVSNTRNEKTINQLVSNIRRRQVETHQTYLIDEREIPKAARKVVKNEKIVAEVVSSVRRPVATHQTYIKPETFRPMPEAFRPKFASKIKNEKIIYDLVTNAIQHRAHGNIQAPRTHFVGEREPVATKSAEKIIKNERLVSDLVTKNIRRNEKVVNDLIVKTANESLVSELVNNKVNSNVRRNEKVINDLVSKTAHHREKARVVAMPDVAAKIVKNEKRNEKIINDFTSSTVHHKSLAPNVAAKVVRNESRINERVSNDVRRNEEIINRLVTTTRREGGRSNQLLIVGAHGPELFIPKAAGSIIKNEQRINELVSNIEHRNIDRRSEKTIDEIISSTVQRRAKSGPVAAYQTRLVGERGFERFIGSETNITNNNGLSVPADFFSNASYRRAMGGPVIANQPYIVGERGPEWFVPKTAGTIVPNGKAGGMVTNIQFVLPPGGYTRATQNQIAADAGRALSIANRRLG